MNLDQGISNLVFEGGVVRGLVFAGAIKYIEEVGVSKKVKRTCGASAGAITSLMIGLGCSSNRIKSYMLEIDFNKFLDSSSTITGDIKNLIENFGLYKGDYFYDFIGELIATVTETKNPDLTFADIEKMKYEKGYLDMTFIVANLSTGLVDFCNNYYTPNLKLRDAVRMSMSVPLFFSAMQNDKKECIVDGGLILNSPTKMYDKPRFYDNDIDLIIPDYYKEANKRAKKRNPKTDGFAVNPQTLSFRVDQDYEISVLRDGERKQMYKIENFIDYLKALLAGLIDAQQRHFNLDDWERSVFINSGHVKSFDFDMPDEDKQFLIQSGYDCAANYFKWRDLYIKGDYEEARKIRPRTGRDSYDSGDTDNSDINDLISDTNDLLGE